MLLSAGAATALAVVTVLAGAASSDQHARARRGRLVAARERRRPAARPARRDQPADRPAARDARGRAPRCPSSTRARSCSTGCGRCCVFTLLAGGLAFLAPQIPGIAAGFAIIWALAWRRQDAAVAAIEERDGASFYVRRTSPLRPMSLLRTPGFKSSRVETVNGAVT